MANELVEFQREVKEWITEILPKRNPHKTTVKMVGEAVELLEAVIGVGGDPKDECADVLILLVDVADQLGIDLLAEGRKKLQINREREWRLQNGALVHIA